MPEKKEQGSIAVPEWLLREEVYTPGKDREGFLSKTVVSVLAVLSRMKHTKEYRKQSQTAPALRIAGVVFLILLLSLSKNLLFPVAVIVGILVRLAFLSGKQIRRILAAALGAVFLSALILLPAAVLGNLHTFVYITVKVAASVTILGILSDTMPWNQITAGLKLFHLPDIFIFTLDITLKYIALLGEICFRMLQALKVRSIGKNTQKSKTLSAILGVTFLKSKELSDEMYQAMECRGFDGSYVVLKKRTSPIANLCYLLGVLCVVFVFLKLEGYL